MSLHPVVRPTLLAAAIAALLGCSAEPAATAATVASADTPLANATALPSEDELVAELASSLQACSYDGAPVTMDPARAAPGADADGRAMVAEIMQFTGLPANFDVVEHPDVANAAAVIVLGPDRLPRRLIAYNPEFIALVRRATRDNDWAPASVMAHEIAHHLSGHTIVPGGSQPPTELEADKFSGFVLFKMGAPLADTQAALNALVPEQDGPTHPGRGRRIAAIAEGWRQACAQTGGACDGAAVATAAATPAATAAAAPAPAPAIVAGTDGIAPRATMPVPPADAVAVAATGARRVDVLPLPSADAIPAKFDRFVIDELGILDEATRAAHEQAMFAHARDHGVEIVTLMVKDLHGLDADAYAQAMLRQLRVGKLDVGNGAVFVVAPGEGKVGAAFGAGVRLELAGSLASEKERLANFLEFGFPNCDEGCSAGWTDSFLGAAAHVADDTDSWEWTIRYQSAAEITTAAAAERARLQASGDRYEPQSDPTWRKLVRVQGTLVQRDAAGGPLARWVDARHAGQFGRALQLQGDDGRGILVYVDALTEAQMTQPLVAGRRYTFVARERSLSHNPADPLLFDGLSYDAMP